MDMDTVIAFAIFAGFVAFVIVFTIAMKRRIDRDAAEAAELDRHMLSGLRHARRELSEAERRFGATMGGSVGAGTDERRRLH